MVKRCQDCLRASEQHSVVASTSTSTTRCPDTEILRCRDTWLLDCSGGVSARYAADAQAGQWPFDRCVMIDSPYMQYLRYMLHILYEIDTICRFLCTARWFSVHIGAINGERTAQPAVDLPNILSLRFQFRQLPLPESQGKKVSEVAKGC